jgi:hypothetical protein
MSFNASTERMPAGTGVRRKRRATDLRQPRMRSAVTNGARLFVGIAACCARAASDHVIDRASNQAKPRRKHAKYLDTRSGRWRLAMVAGLATHQAPAGYWDIIKRDNPRKSEARIAPMDDPDAPLPPG